MADSSAFENYERALESLYLQADSAQGLLWGSSRQRRRNMLQLRRRSLQIAQLLDGDFSSMLMEFREAFPTSYDTMPFRVYPLIQRVSHELATLYARDPSRIFNGPDDANGSPTKLTNDQFRKLRDIYDRSFVNTELMSAHRQLVPQQTMVMAVLPVGPRRVLVRAIAPYQTYVVPGNAMMADDITMAKEVRLKLPIAANDEVVMLGWAVFTPTECYWDADGEKSSIFDRNNPKNIANPWPGTIPLVAMRAVPAPPGCFLSSLADDLLHEQVGICCAISQLEHLARNSGPTRVIVPGPDGGLVQDMADGLPTGADSWVALPGMGSTLSVVQPQPLLGEYRQLIDWQTGLLANFHDVSPDSFSKSPAAKTSVSRAYDRADRAEHRRRYERIFEPVETDLARLIAKVSNLDSVGGIMLPEDIQVNVSYQEPDDSPADPVHEMQANLMAFRSGIDSPVDWMARQLGISKAAAKDRITANLTQWAEFAKMMPSDAMNIDAPMPKADQ